MSNNKNKNSGIKEALKEYWYVFTFILLIFAIFFLGLVYLTPEINFAFPPKVSISNMGVFGDSFNVLTSLFTGLAFAGLLTSIFIQRREFKLQQEELAETKKEFAKMNVLQIRQQFKNDVQRDIEYIKNSIDDIDYLIIFTNHFKIEKLFAGNKVEPDIDLIFFDLHLIHGIICVSLLNFRNEYNDKDKYQYASKELNKIIMHKRFHKILTVIRRINVTIIKYPQKYQSIRDAIRKLSTTMNSEMLTTYLNDKTGEAKVYDIKKFLEEKFILKEVK